MTITKPMQQALDTAVLTAWQEIGACSVAPITPDYELPQEWKPSWFTHELTLQEITDEQSRELEEITDLYNEEFSLIWQSFYSDHISYLAEEEEYYNYLRTESVYW